MSAERTRDVLKGSDALTCALLDEGVPVEELVYSYVYHNECGTEAYYHFADTRAVWLSSLAIEKAGNASVVAAALEACEDMADRIRYRPFAAAGSPRTSALPPVPLEPGANVVIPEAVILAPFSSAGFVSLRESEEKDLERGRVQVLGHGQFVYENPGPLRMIGPALQVDAVTVRIGGHGVRCAVHAFDSSNLYVLDRHWMIGCCPHLFYRSDAGEWSHGGAILVATGSGTRVSVRRTFASGL